MRRDCSSVSGKVKVQTSTAASACGPSRAGWSLSDVNTVT